MSPLWCEALAADWWSWVQGLLPSADQGWEGSKSVLELTHLLSQRALLCLGQPSSDGV